MTNELRANDYTDNLNEDAFKGIEQAAPRDGGLNVQKNTCKLEGT